MSKLFKLSVLAIILSLFAVACSDDDNPADGDDDYGRFGAMFEFTADGETKAYNYGGASYATEEVETYIFAASDTSALFGDATQGEYMAIIVPGKTIGSFAINDEAVTLIYKRGTSIYFGITGDITITDYGPVGGKIKGEFTGQLKDMLGGTTMEVEAGQFSVTRFEDDEYEQNGNGESPQLSAEFTIDGYEYDHEKIEITVGTGNAMFITTGILKTSVILSGIATINGEEENVSINMTIDQDGPETGEFNIDIQNTLLIITIGHSELMAQTGKIYIDKYGNVGEKVEGRFEGEFENLSTTEEYQISDGSYSAERTL
jgi:hypothetical protein